MTRTFFSYFTDRKKAKKKKKELIKTPQNPFFMKVEFMILFSV
jgi:hypothetical protein